MTRFLAFSVTLTVAVLILSGRTCRPVDAYDEPECGLGV